MPDSQEQPGSETHQSSNAGPARGLFNEPPEVSHHILEFLPYETHMALSFLSWSLNHLTNRYLYKSLELGNDRQGQEQLLLLHRSLKHNPSLRAHVKELVVDLPNLDLGWNHQVSVQHGINFDPLSQIIDWLSHVKRLEISDGDRIEWHDDSDSDSDDRTRGRNDGMDDTYSDVLAELGDDSDCQLDDYVSQPTYRNDMRPYAGRLGHFALLASRKMENLESIRLISRAFFAQIPLEVFVNFVHQNEALDEIHIHVPFMEGEQLTWDQLKACCGTSSFRKLSLVRCPYSLEAVKFLVNCTTRLVEFQYCPISPSSLQRNIKKLIQMLEPYKTTLRSIKTAPIVAPYPGEYGSENYELYLAEGFGTWTGFQAKGAKEDDPADQVNLSGFSSLKYLSLRDGATTDWSNSGLASKLASAPRLHTFTWYLDDTFLLSWTNKSNKLSDRMSSLATPESRTALKNIELWCPRWKRAMNRRLPRTIRGIRQKLHAWGIELVLMGPDVPYELF